MNDQQLKCTKMLNRLNRYTNTVQSMKSLEMLAARAGFVSVGIPAALTIQVLHNTGDAAVNLNMSESILDGKAELVDISSLNLERFARGEHLQGEHSYGNIWK